MQKQFEEQHKT